MKWYICESIKKYNCRSSECEHVVKHQCIDDTCEGGGYCLYSLGNRTKCRIINKYPFIEED